MSFVSRFKDSTIGFSGYARLLRDKASGFGYMALLLALVLAVAGGVMTVQVQRQMVQTVQDLKSGPDFSLNNGQVNFNGPMPYKAGQVIVDTTGKSTAADLKRGGPTILITKDKLYQMQALGQVQTTDLSMMPITLTKADVISFMQKIHWFVPVVFVLMYPFQLGFKALDAVILALIAMMFGSMRRRKVDFGLGFKTGLYAITLSTIIQWVFQVSTMTLWGFVVWWGIAGAYTMLGLNTYLQTTGAGGEPPYPENPPV